MAEKEIDISRGNDLSVMLDVIVRAKRDGMIDHKEARDLWADCVAAISKPYASGGGRSAR